MEISFHISWRRNFAGGVCLSNGQSIDGLGALSCQDGCDGNIRALSYICTDFSTSENWQYGGDSFSYAFPVNSVITIGFTGCCWISPFSSGWNISTTFSLAIRSDTGQINSSPRAVTAPVLRLQENCDHIILLAVNDPDDDIIRCRWAVGAECAGICDKFPGAQLNSTSCTLTYTANRGTGFNAVALMIEDFMPGSTQPMSSVALQFLVLVVASNDPCSQQPEFIDPTLPQGSCISIAAGGTFTTRIIATSHSSSVSIIEIQTISPIGLNRGTLQQIQGTENYYIDITWSPTASQLNQIHIFCYTALNSVGSGSQQSCIQLSAGFLPPRPLPSSATPVVHPSNATLVISFDENIQRPTETAFIVFYEFLTDAQAYRIDAFSSPELTVSGATEITLKPNYLFTENTIYYITFSEGIIQRSEGCGLKNEAVTNKTFWNFEVMDVTPPVITFIENPTQSNEFGSIFIAWMSNENVTWECFLISSSTDLSTAVDCSNASWSGYNLERGNYTLNISGYDAAGNKGFLSHAFSFTSMYFTFSIINSLITRAQDIKYLKRLSYAVVCSVVTSLCSLDIIVYKIVVHLSYTCS